eukprot:gnl/TRDRNA2_/TRDRNA2_94911_c0_seq1.p1 gnl/TRDRNA2_/TRDRNA2_94911_c0~~gnl/TRDRNA2_/TRDRNA2_94911_c0_seq1.p1  ORF type:complete len:270 (+),score=29.76 gnl/TRDRNA2_/TRDRNA2_94911_c0_seq1:31-810(+)
MAATQTMQQQMAQAQLPPQGQDQGQMLQQQQQVVTHVNRANEPGSWVCVCGNVNFPGRTVCNSRKCGLPQSMGDQAIVAAAGGYSTVGGVPTMPGVPAVMGADPNAGMMVNTVMMAPGVGGMPGQMLQPMGQPMGQQMLQPMAQPMLQAQAVPGTMQTGMSAMTTGGNSGQSKPRPNPQDPPPPGSWMCIACNNINWPMRSSCGRRTCGQPRSLSDANYIAAVSATAPAGSWMCPFCNNVNWPARTVCNGKNCHQPKPA